MRVCRSGRSCTTPSARRSTVHTCSPVSRASAATRLASSWRALLGTISSTPAATRPAVSTSRAHALTRPVRRHADQHIVFHETSANVRAVTLSAHNASYCVSCTAVHTLGCCRSLSIASVVPPQTRTRHHRMPRPMRRRTQPPPRRRRRPPRSESSSSGRLTLHPRRWIRYMFARSLPNPAAAVWVLALQNQAGTRHCGVHLIQQRLWAAHSGRGHQ